MSGREVFEFRPELVDDDDAEADDTQYVSEEEEEEEEVNVISFDAYCVLKLTASYWSVCCSFGNVSLASFCFVV